MTNIAMAAQAPDTDAILHTVNDISVVVPVRNAEAMLEECLASIQAQVPREIIVVDGNSTDGSLEIARRYGARILSDGGRGLPAARMLGARAASARFVALVDADVLLGPGSLARLRDELVSGGFDAIQAGLESVSGPGYWGRALAHHHRSGRSKHWFGLSATVVERETLLSFGFDPNFSSGEDIELRWRLRNAGAKASVSETTVVEHRFGDTFVFAKGQWLADGEGLGLMIRKHGVRGLPLLALPLAAGLRGVALSVVRREPRWIPYYACFTVFNYVGMARRLAAG
jgi:glycosyltransferase involved in cell wall biosynthesis